MGGREGEGEGERREGKGGRRLEGKGGDRKGGEGREGQKFCPLSSELSPPLTTSVPQCNSASGDGWAKFLRDHQTPSTMFELFFGDEVFGGMLSGINEITHLKPMLMRSILSSQLYF